jgi:hypothetical protein
LLKQTLNEWILKANTSLRSLPINPEYWKSVLDSMQTPAPDAHEEAAEGMMTQWISGSDTPGKVVGTKVIAWNVNGFRRCLRSGAFREFILDNDPDVLYLTEVKCALASVQLENRQ